jgi:S-formylglutathione hydrolase
MSEIEILSEQRCFDGIQGFYRHTSVSCGTEMTFGVYRPPQALGGAACPTLFYLAGLTCTAETFTIKAGAQRVASELGLVLVMPDTSPRGAGIPGEDDDWDFGTGAGFYLDAMREPWSKHYNMESYVTRELPELIAKRFPVDSARIGVFGHSMGGHGALTLHLRHPELFQSASAFAPVSAPTRCPWGEKAFSNYLGEDRELWKAHDASELARNRPSSATLLVDQGTEDPFLEVQLKPELLEAACSASGQNLDLRMREGYDHSYYFIQSFVENHLRHHAAALRG